MQRITAEIISYTLSPVVLSILGTYYLAYRTTGNQSEALFWAGITTFFACVVGAYILFGVHKGFFSNLDVSKRKDRKYLYPFMLTIMIIYAAVAIIADAPAPITSAVLFLIPTIIIFQFINEKVKASIHMACISGATVGFAIYYGGAFFLPLFLIPLVAWARIAGKKHTKNEVIIGTVFGAIFAIFGVYIVQFFR